jgi:hypothetical protein
MGIDRQEVYNKFTALPDLSYNCVKYLMDNDQTVWKLLKYSSPDAWDQPDLTISEKGSLIYDGSEDTTNFRIFLDVGQDDSWIQEACIIRISPLTIIPTNYVYGQVIMSFEIYSHYKVNHLSNYTTRLDMVTQRLIEVFNGAEIGGLGRLYFDKRTSPQTLVRTIGSIPMKGKVVTMCNYLG